MTIHASGRLRHCWFGDYSAVIGLRFDTPALAEKARVLALDQFIALEDDPRILRFQGGGQKLKAALAQLKAVGADLKKVSSLQHSIDYGEPFELRIRTEAMPDGSMQGDLLAAATALDVHAGEQ